MTKIGKRTFEWIIELIMIGALGYIIAVLLPFNTEEHASINTKVDEIHKYVQDLEENGIDVYITD